MDAGLFCFVLFFLVPACQIAYASRNPCCIHDNVIHDSSFCSHVQLRVTSLHSTYISACIVHVLAEVLSPNKLFLVTR